MAIAARDTGWFKSSRSSGGSDNCIEVRLTSDEVGVRDSKARTAGTLHLTSTAWSTFTSALKTGAGLART
ncbi:DUF397 domain-containing protein [Fodinicola acaciae]|uniref:DUF397 domain-containing protein n=1 Tax=Fodinicola acaciae TaxID=2681555 RepID=UPI0013D20E7E|nr:DUF397 domain-containing protein [Fodinicola acaciae]